MISPQKFSEVLKHDGSDELPDVLDLLTAYPYFWPAGMLWLRWTDSDNHPEWARWRQVFAASPQQSAFVASGAGPVFAVETTVSREKAETISAVIVPETEVQQNIAGPAPAHALEHDPLEDVVSQTFSAEQGFDSTNTALIPEEAELSEAAEEETESILQPLYTADYFSHQGVPVPTDLPRVKEINPTPAPKEEEDRGLMVVRSFAEWMQHLQRASQEAREEDQSKKAVRAMWQKEKLAAAMEEEEEEIPEEVFQMAVASIAPDGVVSESLAEVLAKQGRWERAVEMYRKLSAGEPSKSVYFARKIEALIAQHSA